MCVCVVCVNWDKQFSSCYSNALVPGFADVAFASLSLRTNHSLRGGRTKGARVAFNNCIVKELHHVPSQELDPLYHLTSDFFSHIFWKLPSFFLSCTLFLSGRKIMRYEMRVQLGNFKNYDSKWLYRIINSRKLKTIFFLFNMMNCTKMVPPREKNEQVEIESNKVKLMQFNVYLKFHRIRNNFLFSSNLHIPKLANITNACECISQPNRCIVAFFYKEYFRYFFLNLFIQLFENYLPFCRFFWGFFCQLKTLYEWSIILLSWGNTCDFVVVLLFF